MARITTVAKAQASKKPRRCMRCREDIEVGQSYQHVSPNRYMPTLMKHTDCQPGFKQSEMTGSKMATAYAAQEDAHDALGQVDAHAFVEVDESGEGKHSFDAQAFVDEVKSVLEECSNGIEECRDDYQDGLDAMPEGLQQGPTGEEISEKIDVLDSFADDLGSFDPTVEFDEDDINPDAEEGAPVDAADFTAAVDDFAEQVLDEAREAIDGLEL